MLHLSRMPYYSIVVIETMSGGGREVAIRCHGVYDLAAAEAQYHLRCYNEFRKIPYNTNNVALYAEAMKILANEMYANQKQCARSSMELYDQYLGCGGQLVRK